MTETEASKEMITLLQYRRFQNDDKDGRNENPYDAHAQLSVASGLVACKSGF